MADEAAPRPSAGQNAAIEVEVEAGDGRGRIGGGVPESLPSEKFAAIRIGQQSLNLPGVNVNTISATTKIASVNTPQSTDHTAPADDGQPWFRITETAGLITVRASPEAHRQIEDYLAQVQSSAHRQVVVEARIVALIKDKTTDRGMDVSVGVNNILNSGASSALNKIGFFGTDRIDTGGLGGGFFQLSSNGGDMSLVIQSLSKIGDVYTISSPKLLARNNQMSRVSITRTPRWALSASRNCLAMDRTTSFSRSPVGPMAPGSSPPWPGSIATMTSYSAMQFVDTLMVSRITPGLGTKIR
jgi:hypothetical protein